MATFKLDVYTSASPERSMDTVDTIKEPSSVTDTTVSFYLAPRDIPWWPATPYVHEVVLAVDGVEIMRKVQNPPLLFTGVNDFQVDCIIDGPINWQMVSQ